MAKKSKADIKRQTRARLKAEKKNRQKAKRAYEKAQNEAVRQFNKQMVSVNKMIAKGEAEGYIHTGKKFSEYTRAEKIRAVQNNELNPMKIYKNMEYGLRGNVGSGHQVDVTDKVLLPSGIKRSQTLRTPLAVQLARRYNENRLRVVNNEATTNVARTTNYVMYLEQLNKKGLIKGSPKRIFKNSAFTYAIDVKALSKMSPDEQKEVFELIRNLNESPEMSDLQEEFWSTQRSSQAEHLGISRDFYDASTWLLTNSDFRPLWDTLNSQEHDSEEDKELYQMQSFVFMNQASWKDDATKEALFQAVQNGELNKFRELVINMGFKKS